MQVFVQLAREADATESLASCLTACNSLWTVILSRGSVPSATAVRGIIAFLAVPV